MNLYMNRKVTQFIILIQFLLIHLSVFSQKDTTNYIIIQNNLVNALNNDQKIRFKKDSLSKIYGNNSSEVDSIWTIIKKTDSLNLIIVTNILDNYGWPDTSQIGVDGNLAIWAVIQHTPDIETHEKYLPLLKKATKNGFDKKYLAYSIDRIAVMKGKPQIYGTQLFPDPWTGKLAVYPIKNPLKVDKRREKIGLNPITNYLKKFGIKWNAEKHKKNLRKTTKRVKKDHKEYLKKINKCY